MPTKVMKYEIIKPINIDWRTLNEVLGNLQYQSSKLANKAIQMLWDFSNIDYSYKKRFGKYFDLKKSPLPNGYKNITSDILNEHKEDIDKINSFGKDALIKMVKDKWDSDFSEVIRGRRSIANFKRDIPIELHNKQISIINENDKYYFDIKLISQTYAKELGRKPNDLTFRFLINPDRTQKAILDRVVSGEYKMGMSKILKKKKGKIKWFVNLTYSFTPDKIESLKKENIIGIDMGINYPAYIALNNSRDKYSIEGKEVLEFRRRIVARRNELLRQGKYCGDGRKGRGRKTRIKPIEKLRNKVADFKSTTNHKYSKYIIDIAIKHNCGTIQMEDLSGIASGEKKSSFLGEWTYYDLQQKIEYKAKEKGIKVIRVKPNYTSARCSECGFIHKNENKKVWRPKTEQFKCMNCDYGHKFFVHADYNAAKNIATPGIEEEIEQQLKAQKKYEEMNNKRKQEAFELVY